MGARERVPLPIDDRLGEIVEKVSASGVLVLQAPPGAGKTTRVPAALLDGSTSGQGKVVVLEPRRLAARLSARRVAEERGERVGETVGYEVRFERSLSPSTRLEFVTEGILTRRLIADSAQRDVAVVVLDEFHERHLKGDIALALLARMRKTTRPDLKLVVMSATLDALPVAGYLDAPLVTSSGRQYEVSVTHQPVPDERPLEAQVVSAIRELLGQGVRGDILVFLPGAAEIRRAMQRSETLAGERDLLLAPLHGDLSIEAQDLALRPAGKQKVIFSTNVAETSVTIEGVEAVVDSGLARIARYDPWSGRPSLEVAKISRASATQRAGRAGRLGPGRAVRLYSKGDFEARREHDAPGILRADLAETVLTLRSAGVSDISQVTWLDPPPRAAILGAEQLLFRLGALDSDHRLTQVGREMSRFALPPRLSKLIVEAASRGAVREGCILAAMLAEGRDVYARGWNEAEAARPDADEPSDLLVRLADVEQALERGWDRQRARQLGLDASVVQSVQRAAEQYLRVGHGLRGREKTAASVDVGEALQRAVLAAYPDRVARRRKDARAAARLGASRELLLSTGGTALLAETSVVRTAPWLVAVEAGDRGGQKRQTRVWLASAVEPEWLIDLYPGAVEEKIEVNWLGDRQEVEATERLMYERLVLDERPAGSAADPAAAALLAEKALAAGIGAIVGGDAFERLCERLAFVSREAPDLAEGAGLRPLD